VFEQIRTYQTRILLKPHSSLSAYASLMAQVEHCLFADIAKGKKANSLKSSYLIRFGITARQFNSVRIKLEGKIASIKTRHLQLIEQKKEQIKALEEKIPKIRDKNTRHAKKRRLATLLAKLGRLDKARDENKVSLCFGARKLLAANLRLKENGYTTHEEWKRDWQQARSCEIFLIGSKDETSGNQSCSASLAEDGSIDLRVRLPDALVQTHGKYEIIQGIRFAYGHEAITSAIRNAQLRRDLHLLNDPNYKHHGQAITFRFIQDQKGWRIFASVEAKLPPVITLQNNGVIGVDINSDHLAIVETDRFGNPIAKHTFPLSLNSKTKHQALALIGDACKQIIALCATAQKPLVTEELDFRKKKAQLKEKHTAHARMLSAFAYASIRMHLKSRGASQGIQVHSVNPAYTSLIGRTNYAKRYGLSIHHAAALCIGRRSLRLSEKMPQGRLAIPDGKGCHVTLDLPARNRSRHVWHHWGQLGRKLSAALTAHFRAERNRSSSSHKTALEIIVPDLVGVTPARESSEPLLC
jgi:IS605 OrfB family transposase